MATTNLNSRSPTMKSKPSNFTAENYPNASVFLRTNSHFQMTPNKPEMRFQPKPVHNYNKSELTLGLTDQKSPENLENKFKVEFLKMEDNSDDQINKDHQSNNAGNLIKTSKDLDTKTEHHRTA